MSLGKINLSSIVPIVGDGAIADPEIGDGRLIPVLILDCDLRTDVLDMVLLHMDNTPPGDVHVRWGVHAFSKKIIYLTLDFKKPMPISIALEFNVSTMGGLVDFIIGARAVYLQPKDSGARVSEGMNKPRIIVEIPPATKLKGWDGIYSDSLIKIYRKLGASRREAKQAAVEHIARLKEFGAKRMPHPNSSPKTSDD